MDVKFEHDLIKQCSRTRLALLDGCALQQIYNQKFLFTEILPKPFFVADMYPQDSFKSDMNLIRKIFFLFSLCLVYFAKRIKKQIPNIDEF